MPISLPDVSAPAAAPVAAVMPVRAGIPDIGSQGSPRRQSRLGKALDLRGKQPETTNPAPRCASGTSSDQSLESQTHVVADRSTDDGEPGSSASQVENEPVCVTTATRAERRDAERNPFEPPPTASERRRSPRYQIGGDVKIHFTAVDRGHGRRVLPATPADAYGRMIDLSTGGVAFETDADLSVGQALLLTLSADISSDGPSLDVQRLVRACVIRTIRNQTDGWTVVCRFESALSFDVVHRIGSHLFVATIV